LFDFVILLLCGTVLLERGGAENFFKLIDFKALPA
jgi:hypothetical protein